MRGLYFAYLLVLLVFCGCSSGGEGGVDGEDAGTDAGDPVDAGDPGLGDLGDPEGDQSGDEGRLRVDGVSPGTGSVLGGQAVTITGGSFEPGAEVRFGERVASVSNVMPGAITAATPAGPMGLVDVTVSQSGESATLQDGYEYTCTGGDLSVPDQHGSITSALAAASPGQIVLVCPGTYSPSLTSEALPLEVADGIRLVGAGIEVTTIDAEYVERTFNLSGDGSGVEGFTIRRGESSLPLGGAMRIHGAGSPRVAWNRFLENRVEETGGAIYVDIPSSPVIEHNLFERNETTYDMGSFDDYIGGAAIAVYHTSADIRYNTFIENTSAKNGGAVLILQIEEAGNRVDMVGNLFEGNTAAEFGAAVDVEDTNPQLLLGGLAFLSENVFRNNGTPDVLAGGAVSCFLEYSGSFPAPAITGPTITMEHNLFEGNQAHYGAAVNSSQCHMQLSYNRLIDNVTGSGSAGAVYVAFNPPDNPTPVFVNNDFVGNSSYAVIGGGVLGTIGGEGNYLADNNGAVGPDPTSCPKGAIDGDFSTSSNGNPMQFHLVDACLHMVQSPVTDAGPTSSVP